MLISAFGGLVAISAGYVVAFILLLAGGILALIDKRELQESKTPHQNSKEVLSMLRKWWFWVIVIFGLVVILSIASGVSGSPSYEGLEKDVEVLREELEGLKEQVAQLERKVEREVVPESTTEEPEKPPKEAVPEEEEVTEEARWLKDNEKVENILKTSGVSELESQYEVKVTKVVYREDRLELAYDTMWAVEDTITKEMFSIARDLAQMLGSVENEGLHISATSDMGNTIISETSQEIQDRFINLEVSFDEWVQECIVK